MKFLIFNGTIRKGQYTEHVTSLVENVASHHADVIVFHGDQLYERVGGYGVERKSILDYQRKWYIFGWSFRELLRNTPSIIIPDDHDVFHSDTF